MATRVGKYLYDIDLDDMSIEKLQFLKSGCDCFIKQKQAEELKRKFNALNLEAHALGFDLCLKEDNMEIPVAINCYNFKVTERSDD